MRPLVQMLAKMGLKPDFISLVGLLMVVPFIYFFSFHPWIAFFFLVLNLFFDSLDGSLARFLKVESAKGELTDKAADYLSFSLVFLTFLYFGLLSPLWAAAHLLNYAVMQSFVTFAQMRKVKIFPIVRPKFVIYFFFLLWIITGQNYFDPVLVVLTVYLMISNLFLFIRIRCSL